MIIPSGLENGAFQNLHSAVNTTHTPFMESTHHGASSSVPKNLSATETFASVDSHRNQAALAELTHSLNHINFGFQGMRSLHPHSLPEYNNGVTNRVPFKSSNPVPSMSDNVNSRLAEGTNTRLHHKVGSDSLSNHYNNNEGCKCNKTFSSDCYYFF